MLTSFNNFNHIKPPIQTTKFGFLVVGFFIPTIKKYCNGTLQITTNQRYIIVVIVQPLQHLNNYRMTYKHEKNKL